MYFLGQKYTEIVQNIYIDAPAWNLEVHAKIISVRWVKYAPRWAKKWFSKNFLKMFWKWLLFAHIVTNSVSTNFHVIRAQNRPSVTMETCSKIRGSFLETFGLFLIKRKKMYFFSQNSFEIVHTDCLQVCAKFRGHKLGYAPQVGQSPP